MHTCGSMSLEQVTGELLQIQLMCASGIPVAVELSVERVTLNANSKTPSEGGFNRT